MPNIIFFVTFLGMYKEKTNDEFRHEDYEILESTIMHSFHPN